MADTTKMVEHNISQWSRPGAEKPRLKYGISESETALEFTHPLKKEDGSVITGKTLIGIQDRDGYTESIWIPEGKMSADGLSATDVIRGVDLSGLDYSTQNDSSLAVKHNADDPVICQISAVYVNMIVSAVMGIIATGANDLKVGDETGSDISIWAQNDHTVKPRIYFDDSVGYWVVHWGDDQPTGGTFIFGGVFADLTEANTYSWPNNGVIITANGITYFREGGNWVANQAGGAVADMTTTTAGKGEKGTTADNLAGTSNGDSGAPTLVATDTVSHDTPAAGAIPCGRSSDGKIDPAWLPDSNESLETGENVTAGNTLRLKIDGKVYKTIDNPEVGPLFEALNNPGVQLFASTSIDDNKLAFVYSDGINVSVIAATIDGDHLDFGSEVDIDACTSGMFDIAKLDTDKFGIVYRDTGDTNKGKLAICTVSGTTITDGTPEPFEAGSQGVNTDMQLISPDTDLGVIVWCDDATNDELRARAFTVSGTTPSLGTEESVSTTTNSGDNFSAAVLSTDDFVVTYKGTDDDLYARAGNISGNTIALGNAEELHDAITLNGPAVNNMACAQVDTDKFAVAYYDSGADKEYLVVGTTSGTVITGGTPVEISDGTGGSNPLYLEQFATNKLLLWYHPAEANTPSQSGFGVKNPRGTIAWVTTDGTVPSVYDLYNLARINEYFENGLANPRCHAQLTPFSSDCWAVFMQTASTQNVHCVVMADNNYIGFANATTTSGNNVQVNYVEDTHQTNLVRGAKYWLDSSGGISPTGRTYAGTALSTTKIARI